MKNAVILSGVAWNTSLQRHHNVANWLSNLGYNVFFVEKITSSKFTLKKLIKTFKHKITGITINNPTNGINVISYKFLNPEFKIYNKQICNKIINQLPKKIDLVINYLPINTTKYLLDKINYKSLIYDCVRDFSNWGGYNKNIQKIENEMIYKSNLIFTDSYYLTDKIRSKYDNKKVVQILPIFESIQKDICKEQYNSIKNITYYGQLGNHVDVGLLKELSNENYNINIIGDISVPLDFKYNYFGFYSDKKAMIEKIMEVSDAIIIPYTGNMDGVIPVKTLESMATKKPVFISSFYDSKKLSKYLYVYQNLEELKKILKNYNEDVYKEKIKKINEFLLLHDTDSQYKIFKEEVESLCQKN